MLKKLNAKIILKDNYGTVANSLVQNITFEDECPICGEKGLEVAENRYCADGEFYSTDNIRCKNKCTFKYDDLINLKGFTRNN